MSRLLFGVTTSMSSVLHSIFVATLCSSSSLSLRRYNRSFVPRVLHLQQHHSASHLIPSQPVSAPGTAISSFSLISSWCRDFEMISRHDLLNLTFSFNLNRVILCLNFLLQVTTSLVHSSVSSSKPNLLIS